MRRVLVCLSAVMVLSGCSGKVIDSVLDGLGLVALKTSAKVAGKLASQAATESENREELAIDPNMPAVEASPTVADVPNGSNWQYKDVDSQEGMTHLARLDASNEVYLGDAKEPVSLGLLLRKHPAHGNDVIVSISHSDLSCSNGCYIEMSFNGGEPMRVKMLPSDTGLGNLIFVDREEDKAKLLYQLRSARSMHIEVPVVAFPRQHFIFDVADLNWKYF